QGNLREVREKNDDHFILRKGWDWVTGGGSGDDFVEYLQAELDDLQALDRRDEGLTDQQYALELQKLMGDYESKFKEHAEDMAESDETWNTVGEVGRVVVATTVGIVATAASGGNVAVGFGAAFLTYEAIDGASDLAALKDGKDPYADGHTAFLTG